MNLDGTPRALLPITEKVLVWVEEQRKHLPAVERLSHAGQEVADDLRRIELCALAARDIALFATLYPGAVDASAP